MLVEKVMMMPAWTRKGGERVVVVCRSAVCHERTQSCGWKGRMLVDNKLSQPRRVKVQTSLGNDGVVVQIEVIQVGNGALRTSGMA
jgi:hypothetical protein